MRLVTWNCQGAFASKLGFAEELSPDILVVPECERLESVTQTFGAKPLRSVEWAGDMPGKGLGVFAFGDYSIAVHPAYDPRHRWIFPLHVSGPFAFTLLAVWTVPHPKSKTYVQPLLEALATYDTLEDAETVLWVGDFNAATRFDKPGTAYKFGDFVGALEAKAVHSLYHRKTTCPHGKETENTLYMQRNEARGYHIDYIFAGRKVHARPHALAIGDRATWLRRSDHLPLILDVADDRAGS